MNERVYLAGGHVYCRIRRQDTDVERCFSCTRMKVLADEASPPFIVCDLSGTAPDAATEIAYAQWRHAHHRRELGAER